MSADYTRAAQAPAAPRFAQRVVLVTGGASGIGAATARRFAREGALVAVGDVNLDAAGDVASEIGGLAVELDVCASASIAAAIARVEDEMGPLACLVNNAGTGEIRFFVDIDEARSDELLDLNLRSVIAMCHAVLPSMQQRRQGSIVNVSSIAGILATAGGAVYSAAKAGVIGLTKALACEAGRFEVRINAVAPGPIETPLLASLGEGASLGSRAAASMVAGTALRRSGRPEEVAAAIAFLASDDASYITGEILTVSGGYA